MPADSPPAQQIPPRHSIDYVLRTAQQNLVALTGQADLKASIIITTSSVVLSISATQWAQRDLRWGIATLAVGVLGALFLAVIAVYPKYSVAPPRDVAFPDGANPLFFGHVAAVTEARYKERIRTVLSDDATLYDALLSDIYQQGNYMLHSKYRYLKASYTMLLGGFALAPVVQVIATNT